MSSVQSNEETTLASLCVVQVGLFPTLFRRHVVLLHTLLVLTPVVRLFVLWWWGERRRASSEDCRGCRSYCLAAHTFSESLWEARVCSCRSRENKENSFSQTNGLSSVLFCLLSARLSQIKQSKSKLNNVPRLVMLVCTNVCVSSQLTDA